MTPTELREARRKLGLNLAQMAWVLGYETPHGKSQIKHMETGRAPIMPAQRRLLEVYLNTGYRPRDWGVQWKTVTPLPPATASARPHRHRRG